MENTEKLNMQEEFLVEVAVERLLKKREDDLKYFAEIKTNGANECVVHIQEQVQHLKGLLEKIEKARKEHTVDYIEIKKV